MLRGLNEYRMELILNRLFQGGRGSDGSERPSPETCSQNYFCNRNIIVKYYILNPPSAIS